ncbi:MAG: AbrB/MazE/SpoVT family DNA-binding domain-containing protein [Bacteriovoracaceae bacterium]|jgi:virulence-associated protein VagC|nr:AbrB/MazE/SpoVT family DNA-binding domain-containing protein [Bacteriovoracaceae bacterium]
MSVIKETTLFMNGRSQAVRVPADMRLSGEKANILKIGNMLIITENENDNPFLALDLAQKLMPDDFMEDGRDLRAIQKRDDG